MSVTLLQGDCVDVMRSMEPNSVDAVVCDPPYGLEFMGVGWDTLRENGKPRISTQFDTLHSNEHPREASEQAAIRGKKNRSAQAWHFAWAVEALRVLKPGGHLVAFGGTRTHHRLMCALEDAGFEIRDVLCWLYGSGFPKSLDVSKALDKAAGARRDAVPATGGLHKNRNLNDDGWSKIGAEAPAMDGPVPCTAAAAAAWRGWGTALKPAWEIIVVASKPLDLSGLCAMLARKIQEATCQLPSFVRDAGPSLQSNLSALVGDVDSVQWLAVAACSTPGALYDLMATSPSEWEMTSSLSIAWSWLDTLAALSCHASTFTTEMAASLTTDLRTLNSCLSVITPSDIIEAATSQPGTGLSASLAASIFSGVRGKLACILAPSVPGGATSPADGLGLRPDFRPIILARKPLSERNVAANVLRWGTGALNINGCRVEFSGTADELESKTKNQHADFGSGPMTNEVFGTFTKDRDNYNPPGRWPANVVLSHGDECELIGMKQVNGNGHHPTARGQGGLGTSGHSGQDDLVERTARGESVEDWQCAPDCPVRMLDEQGGYLQPAKGAYVRKHGATQFLGALGDGRSDPANGVSDKGGPSRFFYTAKASRSEREIGLYGASRAHGMSGGAQNNLETGYDKAQSIGLNRVVQVRNHHPTVKPINLMRWLVRMVTPKGGTVLDCFAGSGSTGIAADREGFSAILIEQNAEYVEIAKRRIEGDAPLFAQVHTPHKLPDTEPSTCTP